MSLSKYRTRELKFLIIFFYFICYECNAWAGNQTIAGDTISDNQTLYNGKIWRNLYYLIKEDQFLFTKEFMTGTVSVKGKLFSEVLLKYDIYKDELITPVENGVILQLNKERIDSFSLNFQNQTYRFLKAHDRIKTDHSFYNLLYNGKTSLLVRYTKKIDKMAVEGKYDKFYQTSRIYLDKGDGLFEVTGRKDLMEFVKEHKEAVSGYMKINKIKVSDKAPESFIPVIRFYDSLR